MHKYAGVVVLAVIVVGCGRTADGVVTDTKANTDAVKGAIETLDVKAAIVADKTIDSGAIDVDTDGTKKIVVLRGSVPNQAQKIKAEQIARDNAKGYMITNQLAVVPTTPPAKPDAPKPEAAKPPVK